MWVRRNLIAEVALLSLLAVGIVACNSSATQSVSERGNQPSPTAGHASWLQGQPARQLGAYSLFLLDAKKNPVEECKWLVLSLESSLGRDTLVVSSDTTPPDDIYLYISYPGDTIRLASIGLDSSRDAKYLLFSVSQRIHNVVAVGLARFGNLRGTAAPAGQLCEIVFIQGKEQTYKTSSFVNQDNNSAPVLEVSGSQPGGSIELAWDERNIGDYNNNGEVEIADITPIVLHFGETVGESPNPAELLVVDGDLNGEINLSDLTPIARNFQRTVEGYTVYHAVGTSPSASDFTALAVPTIARQEVWDNSDDLMRRRRLQYAYRHEVEFGTHHYYVRAYSAEGSPDTQGLPSNTVTHTITAINLPPQWDNAEGVTAAVGTPAGINITFGSATDPEGEAVSYILRYTEGFDPIGTPGTVELTLPPETTLGDAPYTYTIEPLTAGQRYNFLVRAYDPEGNGTTNVMTTSNNVPALGVSTDPWAYVRGDVAGTGSVADFNQPDTFEIAWQYDLGLGLESPDNDPVISKDGWIAVAHNDGTIRRLDMADGSLLSIHPAATGLGAFRPTLDGNTLVVGTQTGLAVYDMATTDPPMAIDLGHIVTAAPLLLGDYVFAATTDGWIIATLVESGAVAWEIDLGPEYGFSLAPVSDGLSLFAARDDGTVFKLDLKTGDNLGSAFLDWEPYGSSLALDTERGYIYLVTQTQRLVIIDTATMLVTLSLTRTVDYFFPFEPCIVQHADPPLVIVGYLKPGIYPPPFTLASAIVAYNLLTGEEMWQIDIEIAMTRGSRISAGSDRIYLLAGDALYLYDFAGTQRQSMPLQDAIQLSSCALAGDKLAFVTQDGLQVASPSEVNLPPEFEGVSSIYSLEESVQVGWISATDDFNSTVHYAIYLSENVPPEFEAPFTHTTVIQDPATGPPSPFNKFEYLLEGLENGTRYYVGVRAADGPWDENPNIDPNTKWLAATPPWQRRGNYLGNIFTMKGITGSDGLLHLVFTDIIDGELGHAKLLPMEYWDTEGYYLDSEYASAIDLDWDVDLLVGIADIPSSMVGTIEFSDPQTGSKELINPSITFLNPQVSVQYGTENALAYTEHINGVWPPTLEGHYYISTTLDGDWQAPVPLDEENYSGRDLDLVLDPADNQSPWVAFQRGFGYAPDFFTCETGQLMYAKANGAGGYDIELVDAGDNAPDSDCGKRVRQVVEANGNIHIAYLDLNASPDQPLGQLKYAFNGGTGWEIETVHSFGLDFQPMGLQHTWGEISLALYPDGTPLIGFLGRISASRNPDNPHVERAYLWVREAADQWRGELLTDEEKTFPRDREPCVLLVDGAGVIHLFFVTTNLNPELVPNTLVHLLRSGL